MRRLVIVLGICAMTSTLASSEPSRRRAQQQQFFCEFGELVTSIETHVTSGGFDGNDHAALWERCRSLRAVFSSTDRSRATVRPACRMAEPQCDWIALVDAYLLHGESQSLPVLQQCAHVRDLVAAGSCGLARPENSTSQPTLELNGTDDNINATLELNRTHEDSTVQPVEELVDSDLAAGNYTLAVSAEGVLATLVQVPSNGTGDADVDGGRRLAEGGADVRGKIAVPVARSYNGHDWEGSMPSPLSFSCNSGGCATSLPATGSYTYELRVFNVTETVALNPAKVASRFLSQATFGPKRPEIYALAVEHSIEETQSRLVEWVDSQMEMKPSLHRAYLRKRYNLAITSETQFTMPMRAPCKEGSSWVDIAFSRVDRGKVIDVSLTSTGSYALSIDGVIRTVVESVTDIRANTDHNCYERGFRTPLDGLPGYGSTDEVDVTACHDRCLRTEGCAYFSFLPSDVQNNPNGSGRCHLQDSSAAQGGSGGVWRTGRRECVPYAYPPEPMPGLENMDVGCWGQCQAHGPCPSFCGENGYCCRYTRDLNGCVTTDPTKTTHRCIPDPSMPAPPASAAPVLEAGQGYILCYATEYAGGDLQLLKPGVPMPYGDWKMSSCQAAPGDMIVLENPRIVLDEPDPSITQQLHNVTMTPIVVGGEMNRFVAQNMPEDCALPEIMTVFVQDGSGKYYRHEARLELVANTIDNPNIERRRQTDSVFIPSLTRTMCPAASRSWSNRRGCVRRNACAEPEFSSGSVVLDDELMRQLFTRSSRYVYYITGLRLDQFSDAEISPCLVDSRWLKTAGNCEAMDTPLDNATRTTLLDALHTRIKVDTPHVRTIDAPAPDSSCTTQLNGVSAVGARLTVDGTCFVHVHPDEYNVYDFGYWAGHRHPGNSQELADGRPNPIQNPARVGQVQIEFPSWHSMDRWPPVFSAGNPATLLRKLGIYGEEVEFSALPTILQSQWLADVAGVVDISSEDELFAGSLGGMQTEACGTAGEVENRVELGHKYGGRSVYAQKPTYEPTAMLWVNAVFHADDQLRQRVAWALNQIYVISAIGVETMSEEPWAAYYDIFVRNAFGNFREMLQEVAYAYPMGKMLTFEGSQSAASSGNFADENFARELIQLFTVGLYHLNSDGTRITDEIGNPMPAYDVKDVASFARAWTGFARDSSKLRTNSADHYIGQSQFIDPMIIDATHRDANPKMNLYDGFIGDGFPACVDLPRQPFLRKGAKYEYLGRRLKECMLPACNDREVSVIALSLHTGSALHGQLCGSSDDTSACTFPDEVTLLNNIPCHAEECPLDRVQFVEVYDPSSGRVGYYEYIPTPCVNFPFFLDGRVVKYGSPWHNDLSCSDQRAVAAAPMCCAHGDVSTDGTGDAKCEYQQERVTYQTAIDRCATYGKGLCYGNHGTNTGSCHPYSMWRYSVWLNRPCTLSVQIQRDGRVSVVHQGALYDNTDPSNPRIEPEEFAPVISVGSKSIFDVVWLDGAFPRANSNCSNMCTVHGESCVCEVNVEDTAVFTDNSRVPTRAELVDSLHVGAVDPEAYDATEYERCTASICSESAVEVWTKRMGDSVGGNSTELTLDEHTVFVVRHDNGRTQLYTNRESRVTVQDFSFRNPPTLINYEHPTHRQAETETNAVLDHLVHHPSTAPFVCKKLIQRLTSSNPSPRYVLQVVTAFRTGVYQGREYSGEYGDLGAAVAAIFLDREARDATLDMDPAAGKLREPLLRVMHLLRSLDFEPRNGIEFELARMANKIGMYAYQAPSIFNFYLPDHVPSGPASKAMLFAPEAEILSAPFVIGYMNGVASLVDNGLTHCDHGFAWGPIPTYNPHLYLGQNCRDSDSKRLTNEGDLSYVAERSSSLLHNSSNDVLGELSLLLTGGHVPITIRDYYESLQRDQPEVLYDLGPKNAIETSGCISAAQDDWTGTLADAQERCSQLSECHWLHRAEVPRTSLALHKPTAASSMLGNYHHERVTDGDPRTLFHSNNAADDPRTEEWFQVDLEVVTVIDSVKIWHRTDCCGTRINGATILISDTPDFAAGNQCGGSVEYENPSSLFECPMSGRYVTVRLTTSFLQLNELEVFGPADNWRVCGPSTAMVEPRYSPSSSDVSDNTSTYILARDDWKLGRDYWAGDTNTGISSVEDCLALAADWHALEVAPLLRPETTYFSYNAGNNWCQFGGQAAFDNGTPSTGDGTFYTAFMYTPAENLADVFAHTRIKRRTDLRDVLPQLIKLFAFSAEFHATNLNILQDQPRPALPEIPSQNRVYKAIIVLFFEGGADSFSMLIPLSDCQASVGDLYAQYAAVRGNVALTTAQILPMSPVETNPDFPNAPTQPCATFGTHPNLGIVQTLWEMGDAAWFANMGALVEPLTLEQWNTKRKDGRKAHIPPSLFGHDTQQRQCQSVHSDNTGAKGVLGRMMEAMTTQAAPYRSSVYSMYGIRKLVEGDVPLTVMSLTGVDRFAQYTEMHDALQSIVGRESRSIFADTYAGILEKSLEETERLGTQMSDVELFGVYDGNTGLENVAKTIALRGQLQPGVSTERDVFMVGRRTFDSHQNLYSMNANHLAKFNTDLEALHTDLTAMGLWENVVVVTISDFARTLTSNGLGTDHAWGGNYFMLGGSVKGKQIHGQFPDDLDPTTSQLEVGRGRGVLIPTTPWEGMWFGIAQWFGVESDQLQYVVPNAANFVEGSTLFTKEQLFDDE